MMARSPSEVSMVKISEGCVIGWSGGGVGYAGIVPGAFALVTRWYVRGAKRICVGAIGMDEVWVVVVDVGIIFSALVPNCFDDCCKASTWSPWKFWSPFLILCISWVSVVAIIFVMSIGISVGIVQCLE